MKLQEGDWHEVIEIWKYTHMNITEGPEGSAVTQSNFCNQRQVIAALRALGSKGGAQTKWDHAVAAWESYISCDKWVKAWEQRRRDKEEEEYQQHYGQYIKKHFTWTMSTTALAPDEASSHVFTWALSSTTLAPGEASSHIMQTSTHVALTGVCVCGGVILAMAGHCWKRSAVAKEPLLSQSQGATC